MIQEFKHQGNVLAFAQYGDPQGYPIIVHHGLVGSIENPALLPWSSKLKGISLLFIARPGYGRSPFFILKDYAQWGSVVDSLLKQLHIQDFDTLGMSAGAPYSYALGYFFPTRVKRIHIYSGLPWLEDKEILHSYPKEKKVEAFYDFVRSSTLEEVGKFLYQEYIAPLPKNLKESKDFVDSTQQGCISMAQEAKLQSSPWGFNLQAIAQPVFLQHSLVDQEVPWEAVAKTVQKLQDGHLETLENSPHVDTESLSTFFEKTFYRINHQAT